MKSSLYQRWRPLLRTNELITWLLPALLLAGLAYATLANALDGYWRFDDGAHLATAARYSPWQYFFDPAYVRGVSGGAHITPWNILFYDVNLSLFGLSPRLHYAHQLVVLWAAAVASFGLLRLWFPIVPALIGASLFLIGAPTTFVAHQLMTGHYAAGLLFSVLALYCYVLALRQARWHWALASALFYGLAVNCKEVYVPLVVLMPFLPEGDWRTRLRFAWPLIGIAIMYAGWRYIVLGNLEGGYRPGAVPPLSEAAAGLLRIPKLLLTGKAIGHAASLALLAAVAWALYRMPASRRLVLLALLLLLLPLIPLTIYPGISQPDRYLLLPWWATAVLVAALAGMASSNRQRWAIGFCVVLVTTAAVRAHRQAEADVIAQAQEMTTVFHFIAGSTPDQVVVPRWSSDGYFALVYGYFAGVERDLDPQGPQRAQVVATPEQLLALDKRGRSLWAYSPGCHCMARIPSAISDGSGIVPANDKAANPTVSPEREFR